MPFQIHALPAAALRDGAVRYVHLHYARPGCFAASVTRPG